MALTDAVADGNGVRERSRSAADAAGWQQHSVLVVDDEEGMRSFLTRALRHRGCGMVEAVASAEDGARLLERCHFDLVILDIALPGKAGVVWLRELREAGFQGEVILITAFADLESAIDALRAGASDFILKPFRIDQILNSIQRSLDRARLARENYVLRREVQKRGGLEGIVGESAAVAELREIVTRLAPLPSTVLIQGESGTGKEVAARALHALSGRSARPFVPVNCGAISPEIIESELFGHVRGAFTGATDNRNGLFFYAQGGTLFLDEIGELPLAMQTKLLRVLEEKKIRPVGSEREVPVDVRIVAATNRDLTPMVAAGRFRQDLYYRLDVVNITIPPLRERREDILVMARHFMEQLSAQLGMPPVPLSREVIDALMRYHWPGNARELRNLLERSLILGRVPLENLGGAPAESGPTPARLTLEDVEKRHILEVLRAAEGNKSEAARRLGISRKTLERKCALWNGT